MSGHIYGNLLTGMAVLVLAAVLGPALAKRRKLAGWINFLLISVAGLIFMNIAWVLLFNVKSGVVDLGIFNLNTLIGYGNILTIGGLKIYMLVDSFSAFFIAIISFMAMIAAFYSVQYMEHYPEYSLKGYYFNYPVFILGMVGLVTVDDLTIGFTIAWQLMTIASYFLVKFEYRKEENVKSANKYLALMELAWLLIVGATFLIDGAGFGASIHELTAGMGALSTGKLFAIYAMILVGFGFKAGVFPLGQLWLPDAHSIAPSPVSALLSGVMLKTGIYGIIRTFFWMVPHGEGVHFDGSLWGMIIAAIGGVTLFIGTVQSMKQSDAKRLLAYSSIGQIGYIVFAVGAALIMVNENSEFIKLLGMVAIVGALYHILNHAVFKGLLYSTGTKDLNKLGGLLKLMPVTAIVAGIASLSISGVPPFSGFASKWTIISTSLLGGNEMLFLVLFGIIALFTSAITLACYVKFFGMAFTSIGSEWSIEKEVKEVPVSMLIPKAVLTILCIVQGLLPFLYFGVITRIFETSAGSSVAGLFKETSLMSKLDGTMMGLSLNTMGDVTNSAAVPAVLLAVVTAAVIFSWLLSRSGGSEERTADTWLCGYQDLNNVNRYRDRSMYAALRNFLWWTGGNPKK